MIFTILIYLLISVPILMGLLSWRMTGDAKAGWALPREKRDGFLWSVVGLALSLPMFLTGLGCSIFNVGIYSVSTMERAGGAGHGENYDIFFLFALAISVPLGIAGYFGLRHCWRKLKQVFLNQPLPQAKDNF